MIVSFFVSIIKVRNYLTIPVALVSVFMKRVLSLSLILLLGSWANAQVAPYNPEGDFNQMSANLAKINRYLLSVDQGQLTAIKKAVDKAAEDVRMRGMGNGKTNQSIFRALFSIRWSSSFFDHIRAVKIVPEIDYIKERETFLSARLEFNDIAAYTIVHDIADRFDKLLQDILNLPSLDADFSSKLTQFKEKDLQQLLAKSFYGDDLPTLLLARSIHDQLDKFKPYFRNAGTSQQVFIIMGELYTLNDLLSNYAGFRNVPKEAPKENQK